MFTRNFCLLGLVISSFEDKVFQNIVLQNVKKVNSEYKYDWLDMFLKNALSVLRVSIGESYSI